MLAGVQFFPSSTAMPPVRFAMAAQERGFESVFLPDHTHAPVAGNLELPQGHRDLMDPVAVLGAIAAATEVIRIGTAVCLVPQRDPIVLAKQVATLDRLSGGRLLFGVGAGSDPDELRHHGVEPGQRFDVLRERVEAMTRIWTQDVASYSGEHVRFGELWSWPKPLQRPRPPVLVGGVGAGVLGRVLAFGDGWMPFRPGTEQVGDPDLPAEGGFAAQLGRRIAELRCRAVAAGRSAPSVSLFNPLPHRDALDRYREAGVDRVVFWVPGGPETEMLTGLDRLRELAIGDPQAARRETDG